MEEYPVHIEIQISRVDLDGICDVKKIVLKMYVEGVLEMRSNLRQNSKYAFFNETCENTLCVELQTEKENRPLFFIIQKEYLDEKRKKNTELIIKLIN